MRYSRWVSKITMLMGCAMVMSCSTQAFAGSTSSCVTCHIDEDMLSENLAVVKGKKSAKQSGAG